LGVGNHVQWTDGELQRKYRLIHPTSSVCVLGGQSSQHGYIGVNDVSRALNQIHFRQIGFHHNPIQGAVKLASERCKSIVISWLPRCSPPPPIFSPVQPPA